jgi:hypothetical protein
MKQSFTKLFVAFLALLLAPSGVWADSFTFGSTTTAADCKTQFGNDTDLDTEGAITTLSFGNDYDGSGLDLVINSALEIQIAEGLTVNLQSLTCNAPVTVYGGGTLNVSSTSGSTIFIGEEGSFTIGKDDQEAPMNVSITSGTESSDCCLDFDDNLMNIGFTVIGSNVTLSGNLSDGTDIMGVNPGEQGSTEDSGYEEEYQAVSYINCTIDITSETSATITPAAAYYFSFGSLESLTTVTSANVDEVLENSGLSYDADNNMLTISEGAEIDAICTGNPTGTEVNDGLTINVAGDAAVREIQIYADAIITGDGMLTMGSDEGTGANGAIVFKKNADLNFANANITIYKSGATGEYGIYYVDGVETMGLTFDNSNVTISSFNVNEDEVGYAIYGLSEPILNDCSITAPTGTVWVHDTYEDADDYYYTTGDNEENWWGNRVYNLTIIRDSEAPAADAEGDVFYTETTVSDGTLKVPYTILSLMDGETPGEVMFGLADEDYDSEGASYTGTGQIDFEIPESVTSPNGSTYDVVIGGDMNSPMAFFPGDEISFVKTLTIPATLKKFTDYFLSGIIAKNDELDPPVSGLEKVIFAEGSVQDEIEPGDQDMAFFTFMLFDEDTGIPLPSGKVELVIPDDWDNVQNDWGCGDWVGDKVITPIHYAVWVNSTDSEEGIEITSLNQDDVLDDGGSITYDPDTKELTITTDITSLRNGAYGYIDPRPGVDGLKIVIPEGETVEISMVGQGAGYPIHACNNTIITGGGTVNIVNRASNCIEIGDVDKQYEPVPANLTIKDVTVNVYAIGQTAEGIRFLNSGSSLTINHATLNLENQDGGDDYGDPEDVVIYGYAGNEPTFINCEITTTPVPTWASLTGGYWNTNVTDEADRVYGYQVSALTIAPTEPLIADIEDESNDNLAVDLALVPGKTDEVIITAVEAGESATGTVVIPASVTVGSDEYAVTAIGDGAFEGQTNLTGVTLPKTVTSIGENAFAGCTNMTSLKLQSPFAPTIGTGAFDANANLTVNYPAAAYNNYYNAEWTGVSTFQPTVMQPNEWSTICSTQVYTLPEGLEAYIVVGIDYENCAVKVKKMDYILADTPMMLRKIGAAEDYPVESLSMFIYQPDGEQLPEVIGDEDAFIGYAPVSANAAPMELPESSGNNNMQAYILIGNSFVRWTSGTLAPYRCFLWATQEFNTASPARMAIEVVDGEATGVSDVRGKKEDVRNNWYDLSGRRLQSQPTKKGVYVNNGKLMIK